MKHREEQHKTFNGKKRGGYTHFESNTIKFEALLSNLRNVVRWLRASFATSSENNLMSGISNLISTLSSVCKNRGAYGGLIYIKSLRKALSAYLSGTKIKEVGIRLTYDGIPVVLGDLIPLIRGTTHSRETLQYVYTILTATRSLRIGTSADLCPIINNYSLPFEGIIGIINSLKTYSVQFWSELGHHLSKRIPKSVEWNSFHLSSKSGPNGHALKYSLKELYNLPIELVNDIKLLGGKKLSTKIEELQTLPIELRSELLPYLESFSYRRITSFPDKEDKVRVIAILDYWSQTVLKPLHDYLNNILKRIPQDCTFDQAGFWNKIKDSEVFYSVDLTAATDRFPIELIKLVLKSKFPTPYVDAWARIMVGHPFDYKQDTLRYAVGNPMGAYSSWASFAVAHHFVVYSCIKDLGLKWADIPYCLLGDDIVIGHKEVAELYILRIRSLGVEISESKTHKSKHFCEFAKRLIYKGQEITPFPYSSLKEVGRRSYLLTGLILDTIKKGWVPKDSVPSIVSLYYEMLKKYPSRRRRDMFLTSQLTELVMTMTREPGTACTIFYDYIRNTCKPTQEFTKEDSFLIFVSVILDVARNSYSELLYPDLTMNKRPFGSLAKDQIKIVNSYRDIDLLSADISDLSFPMFSVVNDIKQRLSKQMKLLQGNQKLQGTLKSLLKTMTYPSDDRIFIQRSYYKSLAAAAYVSKQLRPILKLVKEKGIVVQKGNSLFSPRSRKQLQELLERENIR